MVIRSMMEAVKDPAFNQALNLILLDNTKPKGQKTAHCLIFICGKLETETFVQIFTVMQTYLRVRQLSTEPLRTYGERCRAAIRDVQDVFTERNQPTDWEALWQALTTGLMFMNAQQDFRDVAMVHMVGWDKAKWTLDNLIALTNNCQDLQRGAGGHHDDSIAALTSNIGLDPEQLTEQVALLLQQQSAAGAPPHQL